MITITPKADKETVVQYLNSFFNEHVSTESKFTHAVIEHFGKDLAWELFSHHGMATVINDDGVVQFRALTRVGFTQLYNTYLILKFGVTFNSVLTRYHDTGKLRTPITSSGIDFAIHQITTKANNRWTKDKAVTPSNIGDIIYEVLEGLDKGVVDGLNARLENEVESTKNSPHKSWVKRFREHWYI